MTMWTTRTLLYKGLLDKVSRGCDLPPEMAAFFIAGEPRRNGGFMEFFSSAVDTLQTLVVALGAGLGVWGVVNLLEGYGSDKWLSRCNQEKKGKAQSRRNRRLCQEMFVE
ncbi:MAG: hypothetical protein BHV90_05610 [Clostridiales bacterium 42_27]|nr:MAG: hypothetical protein BHV90_05610 [Clostridiales bacterium 42_27]